MPSAPQLPPIRPKRTPPPRGSTTERGYGHAHRRQRKRLIAENPLCQKCGDAWAEQLHHLDHNPHNRAPDNVEMLCEKCHREEHGR